MAQKYADKGITDDLVRIARGEIPNIHGASRRGQREGNLDDGRSARSDAHNRLVRRSVSPGRDLGAFESHPLDRPLNPEDRILGAVDGDSFACLGDDVHFDALLVQIGDQLHRGSAIVLLRMRDGHGSSPWLSEGR